MPDSTCSIATCDKTPNTRGYCSSHYHRLQRYGDPLGGSHYRKDRTKPLAKCLVANCTRLESVRGYCDACYLRLVNNGTLQRTRLRTTPVDCAVADCAREVYGTGLCRLHWGRKRRHGDVNWRPVQELSLVERVWRGAPRTESDDCWLWTGAVDDDGYGIVGYEGRNHRPHRVAWEHANGTPISEGQVVRHKCDTAACCNPAHLLIGTQAQNIQDSIDRDRFPRGERSGMAKLTESDVLAIRSQISDGEDPHLVAARFGISTTHAKRVHNRQAWRHI